MTKEIITAFNQIDAYAAELKFLLEKEIINYESAHPGWKFHVLDCKIDEAGTYHFTPRYVRDAGPTPPIHLP